MIANGDNRRVEGSIKARVQKETSREKNRGSLINPRRAMEKGQFAFAMEEASWEENKGFAREREFSA